MLIGILVNQTLKRVDGLASVLIFVLFINIKLVLVSSACQKKNKRQVVTMDQIQFFKPWVVVDLNFNELLEARVSTIWIENIN